VSVPDESATTIRRARVADVPRLRQLGVLGWETTYTDFIRPENRAAYLSGPFWSIQTLSLVVVADDCIALVAESEEAGVVGFLTVEPHAPERDRREITRFYVHPDWRRSGVGSALLAATLERVEHTQAPALMVNVFARNAVGRAFYERAGFRLVDIVPVTVGDQVDEDAWYVLPLGGDSQAHSAA
jgi:GNAT superfamily N-acetyltransferase